MKRFADLNDAQKKEAIEHCLGSILEAIVSGRFKLDDARNKNNAQAVIEAEISKAAEIPAEEAKAGPREIAIGLLMQSSFIDSDGQPRAMRDELLELSGADAEESWFVEPKDKIVKLESFRKVHNGR